MSSAQQKQTRARVPNNHPEWYADALRRFAVGDEPDDLGTIVPSIPSPSGSVTTEVHDDPNSEQIGGLPSTGLDGSDRSRQPASFVDDTNAQLRPIKKALFNLTMRHTNNRLDYPLPRDLCANTPLPQELQTCLKTFDRVLSSAVDASLKELKKSGSLWADTSFESELAGRASVQRALTELWPKATELESAVERHQASLTQNDLEDFSKITSGFGTLNESHFQILSKCMAKHSEDLADSASTPGEQSHWKAILGGKTDDCGYY